jgi:hypothetical protein
MKENHIKIRGATLNRLLAFLVWVSKVKYLCNVCVPFVYFLFFIKNPFVVINCTMLKSTFGIRVAIIFKGMPLCLGVWLRYVINLVLVGAL